MLGWVITFFILAVISGYLGFSGVEIMSLEIARVLFVLFLILFAVSLLMRLLGSSNPPIE